MKADLYSLNMINNKYGQRHKYPYQFLKKIEKEINSYHRASQPE